MNKNDLAAKISANYSLQYLLDRGDMPSRETVVRWIRTLTELSEDELLEVGGDLEAQKRLLR